MFSWRVWVEVWGVSIVFGRFDVFVSRRDFIGLILNKRLFVKFVFNDLVLFYFKKRIVCYK